MSARLWILFASIVTLIDAQCEPCSTSAAEINCATAPRQLYICNKTKVNNVTCVEYQSLCDACTAPCLLADSFDALDADQIFALSGCKKATYDCSGNSLYITKQPNSIFIEYMGYFVLFILVIIWMSWKLIRHFLCPKSKSIAPISDIGDQYELLENHTEEMADSEQPRNININPQKRYSKSMFELMHEISDIVNCTVFILYIEYFTGYPSDSYVYTVCIIFYGIKIIIFICNIIDNVLIFYCSMSNDFIFYFTISIDMINYHLSLMDGMFKLIYSFPASWGMNPSTFWNVTLSLAFAALNGVFLPIKYDLREISVIKDDIIEYYQGSWRDKCCFNLILKTIEYSAKLIVFIPIFIGINTITAGLSVIIIMTKTSMFVIFFGFMWIFGIYMSWAFRKIKLNFFADLTVYILIVNLCEVIDISIITATMWIYGHFDGPSMSWLGKGNLIPDDQYYSYTLSSWIFYIALFFVLWKIYPLIYTFCSGNVPVESTCINMSFYAITYPMAIFIALGMYINPILYSLVAFSGIFNLVVFGGSLIRIISYNIKEICILLLIIALGVGGYFIISAAF